VTKTLDAEFANSAAETRTETEQAFQAGFVAMSGAIINALKLLAIVLNGITILVLANTLVMAVRERTREYAVLRALGFRSSHITALVTGEALLIALLGSVLGIALTIPGTHLYSDVVSNTLGNFFQHVDVSPGILLASSSITLCIAVCASAVPIARLLRAKVAEDLRYVG
jgi:putative ABC transport system permease protein